MSAGPAKARPTAGLAPCPVPSGLSPPPAWITAWEPRGSLVPSLPAQQPWALACGPLRRRSLGYAVCDVSGDQPAIPCPASRAPVQRRPFAAALHVPVAITVPIARRVGPQPLRPSGVAGDKPAGLGQDGRAEPFGTLIGQGGRPMETGCRGGTRTRDTSGYEPDEMPLLYPAVLRAFHPLGRSETPRRRSSQVLGVGSTSPGIQWQERRSSNALRGYRRFPAPASRALWSGQALLIGTETRGDSRPT